MPVDYFCDEAEEVVPDDGVIGESGALRRVLRQVELVAATEASVLIQGESGTGKELYARAIHRRSPRASRALVKVNCASIPKDLFESEFFGHVRASVHGRRRRPRRFRLDLLYRISVFPIYVPALRERREDIALLATRFLRTGGLRLQRTVSSIPERERTKLVAYDWPGNIRELQHVVERAAILASQRGTVQFDVTPSSTEPKRAERPGSPLPNEEEWRRTERDNLRAALEAPGGKVTGPGGAAALLGMNPNTLTSRLRALGLRKTF